MRSSLAWRPRNVVVSACGLLLLASAACTQPLRPTTTGPLPLTRFRADAVAYSAFSGYGAATTLVVRDRDTWQATWNQIHGPLSPIPPLPVIDFSTEMVVVAALGGKPSSGYDIVLTGASEADGMITVDVVTNSPGPNCVTLTVVTAPLDLARMPRRDATVLFHLTPVVTSCQ
jgi:hypothetical protein